MSSRAIISTVAFTALLAVASPAVASPPRHHPWYYPLLLLSPRVYHRFECVLRVESRSTFAHPNTGDNSKTGSSGVYQMEPVLWDRWAPVAGVGTPIWSSTLWDQSKVAATIYKHDGFGPATWNDGC